MPRAQSAAPFTRVLLSIAGFLAAYLPLRLFPDAGIAGAETIAFALLAFVLLVYALSLVGEDSGENRASWARWLTLTLAVLGAGAGIVFHVCEAQLAALGRDLRANLDSTTEIFHGALVLFGVMMGFYVVRNWLKKDEEFIKSLTAAGGGAFLATFLGLSAQGAATQDAGPLQNVDMFSAFSHYFFGFASSGIVNLIIYAVLTSRYSARQTAGSRAVIYFLYGVDKAKALDDYFLENFEKDWNNAKAMLVNALRQLSERALLEYARKTEVKRARLATAAAGRPAFTIYRLRSIEGEVPPAAPAAGTTPAPVPDEDKVYLVKLEVVPPITAPEGGITAAMFRMGISALTPDSLEYIVAPGEYRQPFPLRGSVAGLALRARQTIVMSRDRDRRFRTADERTSVSPAEVDADRGFEEVDYLSYVLVPVASRYGDREERSLGIITADTRLFAAEQAEVDAATVESWAENGRTVIEARMKRKDLVKYAGNLYEERDAAVSYLEEMRGVAVPLLEIYLKYRQGAP